MNYLTQTEVPNLEILKSGTSDIGTSITERFAGIFPSWPIMLATVIAFVIILIVLTKLVYKPVRKMLKNRQKFIQNNIDESEKKVNESNILYEKANIEILDARLKAEKIIKEAYILAENAKTIKVQEAKDKSKQLLKETKFYIDQQKEIFAQESKEEIVNIAGEMAKKIISKNEEKINDEEFVRDLLKDDSSE